jgi:NAD(P)-dependent dehydrogenase (short-subunit alcohol dehydrogenase family)
MDSPFDLTDRVALVTGGGRRIGREITRVLARAGASVAVADIDHSGAADAAHEVASPGRRALGLQANVSA